MGTVKQAIKKLTATDSLINRAVVLSVDKDAMTCNVRQVYDDLEIDAVKLKPVINAGNDALMGIVCFPAVNSFVVIGIVNDNDIDLVVLGMTQIESVLLDFGSNFKLTINKDGKPQLNADLITFNNGSNGGLPLLLPLTQIINAMQKQINGLIDAFTTHTHPTPDGISGITTRTAPAKTTKYIARADIENKSITQ